eukprot:6328806-Pyramimonas_sp.AAC.1
MSVDCLGASPETLSHRMAPDVCIRLRLHGVKGDSCSRCGPRLQRAHTRLRSLQQLQKIVVG